MDGLSAGEIAAAAKDAKERKLARQMGDPAAEHHPAARLLSLTDRDVREKLFNQRWTATEKGDANDTRATIAEIAQLRAEKAKLLGYPNYAAYTLYDQMADTPDKVEKFLGQLVPATAAEERREAKADPERDRQGRGAFRAEALGLGSLCRAGAQSPVRSG